MIPHLAYELTTIPRPEDAPTRIVRIKPRTGNTVEVPFMDHRLATCRAMMDEPVAEALMDLDNDRDMTMRVALKAHYVTPEFDASGNTIGVRKKIAFWGPLRRPEFNYDTGEILMNAVAPSFRMEKAFVVAGDVAIDPGVYLDGRGFLQLLELAQNRPEHDALNWPSLGIIAGVDTSTHNSRLQKLTKYDQIWSQGLVDLGQSLIAADWDVEPFESDTSSIAIGTVAIAPAAAAHTYPAVNDFTITSTLPGEVSALEVAVWLKGRYPDSLRVELTDPGGVNTAWVWDGFSGPSPDLGSSSADVLGTDGGSNMAVFGVTGDDATTGTYPLVGRFTSTDSLIDNFAGFDASGDWVLRVRNSMGEDATLERVELRFLGPTPTYARLNTFDKPDTDDPVIAAVFHHGFGKQNLKSFSVATEGGSLITQAIEVASDDADTASPGNNTARSEYGTWQSCESSTQSATSHDWLVGLGQRIVEAYSRPPMAPGQCKPADDIGQPNLPRFLHDYAIGAHLRLVAKRDNCRHRVVARCMRGVLTQKAGGVETDLTMVPTVAATSEVADA